MGMDVEEEEEEVLFTYTSPPPPSYYVQSPSTTISNASTFEFQPGNHHIHIHELSSPPQYQANITNTKPSQHQPELASRRTTFSSSRCSSTRDSFMSNASNSFENKVALVERKTSIVVGKCGDDDDDDSKIGMLGQFGSTHDGNYEKDAYGGSFNKYLSFGTYDGSMWLVLQLSWRLLVSLAVALLVFYVVTKPPPPQISVKVGGVRQFELAEGVDSSGVSTKIMRCNTSIEIVIDNHSKVFQLHLLAPVLQMSFQHLTFAVSKGDNLVADRQHVTRLEMYLGARSKPMYGAGRMMQDMLDSKGGLPLVVDVSLVSNYRVVAGLIRPWYHHHGRCLVVMRKGYDNKHHTHHFNTTCAIFTSI